MFKAKQVLTSFSMNDPFLKQSIYSSYLILCVGGSNSKCMTYQPSELYRIILITPVVNYLYVWNIIHADYSAYTFVRAFHIGLSSGLSVILCLMQVVFKGHTITHHLW